MLIGVGSFKTYKSVNEFVNRFIATICIMFSFFITKAN